MRYLLTLAVFLTLDLILLGSFVRVSDAGLGCPDWPGCYGRLSPLGAIDNIQQEMLLRPDGPVTVYKAWVEMIHRYVASGLGVMIIWLVWQSRQVSAASLPLAIATLGWVILQGLFGMWTVTMKLQPALVTAHLLGALVLLGMLLAQRQRLDAAPSLGPAAFAPPGNAPPCDGVGTRHLAVWATLLALLLFGQAALGAWVSSNYATLACQDFPLCQGRWLPEMDLRAGFELWRPLGYNAVGDLLPFQALTGIHWVHRWMALVVLAVLAVVTCLAWPYPHARGLAQLLLVTALLQLGTGLTNVFLQWPAPAAILHTGGAAVLFGTTLMLRWRALRGHHSQ